MGRKGNTVHRKSGLPLGEHSALRRLKIHEGAGDVLAGSHYLDVTLSAQVVDLRRLHLVDDFHQARAVSQIAIVQLHV